jgi:hypothetical protein
MDSVSCLNLEIDKKNGGAWLHAAHQINDGSFVLDLFFWNQSIWAARLWDPP